MKNHKLIYLALALMLILAVALPARVLSSARQEEVIVKENDSIKNAGELQNVPTDQIIVKYKTAAVEGGLVEAMGEKQVQQLSDAAGVPLTYVRLMSGDAHVLRLAERMPAADVSKITDRLAALPEVEYAQPDRMLNHFLTPNDTQYPNQWHYFTPSGGTNYGINAPAAWDVTTGSSSVVVAVIDTGITNHADLSGRTVAGYDFIADVFVANDGNGRDSDPSDPGDWVLANECGYPHGAQDSSWHGTHVAGTIGAASNNGMGVAGINWNSKILPVRVLGKCGGYTSDIVDGMRWAAGLAVVGVPANANPAKVMNLSLGGYGSCDSASQSAVNDITAAGATVVVAAGNSNDDASNYSPASCNGVITVASTNRTGDRAYYSNYGSMVEISAPGGETYTESDGILSTLNTGAQGPVADTYAYYQGTSMAAPHVAGVASLVYSLNPSITPAQVLQVLQNTVTVFPGGSSCNTSLCGTGIVNAGSAVGVLPRSSSLSPTSVVAGSGATTLTLNGANFNASSQIYWDGAARTTTFVSSTQLTTALSAGDVSLPATHTITVVTSHPPYGNLTTASMIFRVTGISVAEIGLPVIIKQKPPTPVPTITPTPTPSPTPGPGTAVVNGDFESGPGVGWSEYSTHGWTLVTNTFPGSVSAHSGSYAVWLGGDYNETAYIYQQVTLSAGAPYLVYYRWIASADVCGFDFGGVLVNGTVVEQYDLCQSTSTGGWQVHSLNLSAYSGQTVTLQIRAECDSSLNSNLFIDDVSFSGSPAMDDGQASGNVDPGNLLAKVDVLQR